MRNNQGFTEDSTHWPKVGMWPLASSVGISVVGCGLPMRRKMWKPGLHAAPLPGEAPFRDIVLLPLGYLSSVLQLSPGLIWLFRVSCLYLHPSCLMVEVPHLVGFSWDPPELTSLWLGLSHSVSWIFLALVSERYSPPPLFPDSEFSLIFCCCC